MEHQNQRVFVRKVWQSNLEHELSLIRSILHSHRYVSMDTEFPGEVHHRPTNKPYWTMTPSENYQHIKQNVDDLTIIQLGLTFTDEYGNLPTFDTELGYIWEFNFRDFDPKTDPHNPYSIELLESQGVNFLENKEKGIDRRFFSYMVKRYQLVCNDSSLYWLTFHGSYDFAYLIKILTRNPLPKSLEEFLILVRWYFGDHIQDLKHMMKYCNGLQGGLNKVADSLEVERLVGESHQAGSDSLVTMQVFFKIRERLWEETEHQVWGEEFNGVIYGLDEEKEEKVWGKETSEIFSNLRVDYVYNF